MSEGKLSLSKIVEDVENLFRQLSTPRKYDEIDASPFALHLLNYLQFLEEEKYILFDRDEDKISQLERGQQILVQREWIEDLKPKFGFLLEADDDSSEFPDDATQAQSIQIDDGLDIIDLEIEDIQELVEASSPVDLDPSLLKLEPLDEEPEIIDSQDLEPDIQTEPEIEVIQAVEQIQARPETVPTQNEIVPTKPKEHLTPISKPEPKVTQDTFSSRKLSNTESNYDAEAGYEREELIGAGAYGSVFHAKQLKLNRYVAVKEVKSIFDVFASMQRDDIIERFSKIVQTQASLLHPNIIQIIDFEVNSKFPFVVMPFAPNGNLRRVINHDDRPDLQVSLKYFFQILHALNTAHAQGITHGGIKPENVVLDQAGNALITDFGISSVAGVDANENGANQIYVGVGTISYMSPEQFRNPNSSSVKSDIYSLGIMFYEMLTGKVPGRRSPMPSSFYPDIPRKLDDIFDRMSMDDPDERYDTIEEILGDLYDTPAVMKIIDKRSGFLFLKDPLKYGAIGIEGLSSFPVDDDDALVGDGDMMNKLDKYGKLFDESE